MDNEFEEISVVKSIIGKHTYEVQTDSGKKVIRHTSQLRLFKRGMLDDEHPEYEAIGRMLSKEPLDSSSALIGA